MRAVDIIEKKKRGQALDEAEIRWLVEGCVSGRVPDYQAAAWLMAVWFSGMDDEETAALTLAMARSGNMADLSPIPGRKVDKHSTGGVGDTTTLVAAPLAAACGLPVAKMSGRGLGYTGGTLDKLESIPGVSTAQSVKRLIGIVRKAGFAVVGQSADMAPADKFFYALRDVTATVDSLPLIAASIMSKKIAAGASAIVLDVKTGSGAFMDTPERARALAETMVELGKNAGRETVAFLTDMNQPLGRAVGNGIEVAEAVEILSGRHGSGRLCRLSLELGAEMLALGHVAESRERGMELMRGAIESGDGLRRLKAMTAELGGDTAYLDEPERLYQTRQIEYVVSDAEGWLSSIDVREAGRAAQVLGAGREKKDDPIDPAVGYVMLKELGERVEKGEPLARFHINDVAKGIDAIRIFKGAVRIADVRKPAPLMIYEIIK